MYYWMRSGALEASSETTRCKTEEAATSLLGTRVIWGCIKGDVAAANLL